ncbi:hypothetical protein MUO65_02245 [bacterium]|nr:hypothetical protein [bacterium]
MSEIAAIKDELVDQLWIAVAAKAGDVFYPRLRKNKGMKVLTLTNHENFREVEEFVRRKLTKKDLIYGWNKARSVALRLDSEGKIGTILPAVRYEDCLNLSSEEIVGVFPFDIVNLDFSSQCPENIDGRIEKEIHGLEHTLNIQANKGKKGMALIYTTVLDSRGLRLDTIKEDSDTIRPANWDGLQIEHTAHSVVNGNDRVECLKTIIGQILLKYGYQIIEGLGVFIKDLPNGSGSILSIAGLMQRGE